MTDLYVQVETGLPTSKLVDRAVEMLGISSDVAIAKLVRLWLATMAVGCHGQIGERSDRWIEEAVLWTGEPGTFAAFVRLHHLDSDGVIRDWLDKYGAVEEGRHRARVKKQKQRAKAREEDGVPGTGEGPTGGPKRDVPVTLLQSPISQSQETLSKGNIKSERESEGPADDLATRRADTMQSLTLFLSRYDFGRWRDAVEGYVRASKKPMNVIAHLDLWLTGEMGYKKRTPEEVGFAINQYAASGESEFKAALFDGFVRRVKGQMDRNVGHAMREAESATLVNERREREVREQEEQDQQMLNDFERRKETRFEELKTMADKSIDKRHKGEVRDEMVRGALIALVRKEIR